ncbi:MAG: OpgC domain-containing protein [Vicinamibacterales bacterium]
MARMVALTPKSTTRDLRIDFLRGIAMVCVIVDHSQRTSLLSWFSYERFWVVTAAEVFVVLSGVVLGMVYGPRLLRDGWLAVMKGLCRRALTLYVAFVAVTLSVLALSVAGIDISSVTTWDPAAVTWFYDPLSMNAADVRDLALLRYGPWAFEIVGLYVWFVLAAGPLLILLRRIGWKALLALSWTVYIGYRLVPMQLTSAEFETVFPILAWQLIFVHGLTIGYQRDQISAYLARGPRVLPIVVGSVSATFMAFALSNPAVSGPSWLHWGVVSPQHFASMYERFFALSDLGIGRVLNLAVALPFGYGLVSWSWSVVGRFQKLFVTLGRGSLGAFVLHVYGLLVLDHLPWTETPWINALMQLALIGSIAALLGGMQQWRRVRLSAAGARVLPA